MTQLLIEGYELDIYEGIGALFTYQVDDVSSFAKKNTSFSKTITIPATAKNKKLLGFVEDLTINSDYSSGLPNVLTNYNAGVPANCIVLIDSIQVFKGIIRVLEITNTNGLIEYQCSVFGELGGFFFNLTNKYLSDLDFSAYDQEWTWTNVSASWNNVGSGAFFGLGDYGNCSITSSKHDWSYEAFRPAFFLQEYLNKIFDVSKYSVDMSALTGISWFNRLVVPHNQEELYLPAILKSYYVGSPITQDLRNVFQYVSPTTGDLFFKFYLEISNYLTTGTTTVTVELYKSGSPIISTSATWSPTEPLGTVKTLQFTSTALVTGVVNTDEFDIRISSSVSGQFLINNQNTSYFQINQGTSTGSILYKGIISNPSWVSTYLNLTTSPVLFDSHMVGTYYDQVQAARYNDLIDMNFAIPKNIKLTDFVTSVLKLFNCMIIEDKDVEKGLKIIPYIDYYYPLPTAIDWSNKIDRKTAFKIKPMSELNARYYEFRYDVDSDWINTVYKEKYGIGYGEKVFDSEYQFSKDKSEAKIIFSPSPMFTVSGEEKIFPIFWKSTDNGTTEGRMGTKLRLLFSLKITDLVTGWEFHKTGGTKENNIHEYGYMGHYNDPSSPTFDLNWETPRELYFSFNREVPPNLFNSYWSSYLAEITHKDSKLLVANVYLNKIDIKDLDFSKPIYIDGVLFRLNKVVDYNSEQEGLTKVELLKLNL